MASLWDNLSNLWNSPVGTAATSAVSPWLTVAKLGLDYFGNKEKQDQYQQAQDISAAGQASMLDYYNRALGVQDAAQRRQEKMMTDMFNAQMAAQQQGTDQAANLARLQASMGLAGNLFQNQSNLDQQIKLAQMQQAQTQPQRMAQASAMQSLPMLQRLMGMTPYKLPTSTVENDYSTLGQNVLGDYFKTLQATQPFIAGMMPTQTSSSTTNPAVAPAGQVYTNAKPGSPQALVNDPAGFFDVPEYVNIATREVRKVYGEGVAKRPDAEQIFNDYLARAKAGEFGGTTGTGWSQQGSTNQGVTVGGVAQRAPQIDIEAPQVSQDNQAMYMGQPMGPAIGNLTMPPQYTNSPTTVSTLPDGTAFVMPVNGVDQNVTSVTNTGQPVSYSPVIGAQPGVPTTGGTGTVPNLINPVPNMSTTGSPYGPATTTNPLEVDTALMNKPVSELIQSSPLYQYQQGENEAAIRRMMAQRGLLNSSHTLSATSKAAQALSANEADKQVGRLSAMYNAALGQPLNMPNTSQIGVSNMTNTGSDLSNLSNIYNQAATNRANTFQNYGQNMSNLFGQGGQNQAAGLSGMGSLYGTFANQNASMANNQPQSSWSNLASGVANNWDSLSKLIKW